MSYSITVTIGRNVGVEPLPASSWRAFQDAVAECLAMWCRVGVRCGDFALSHSHGVGEWDGVPEDNYTVTAYGIERLADAAQVFESVRDLMRGYAGIWRQDAIAVTLGTVSLVEAGEG